MPTAKRPSGARAHTKGVVGQHASKKGSEKVLEIAFEKVLRRVLRSFLVVGFDGREGSEKRS